MKPEKKHNPRPQSGLAPQRSMANEPIERPCWLTRDDVGKMLREPTPPLSDSIVPPFIDSVIGSPAVTSNIATGVDSGSSTPHPVSFNGHVQWTAGDSSAVPSSSSSTQRQQPASSLSRLEEGEHLQLQASPRASAWWGPETTATFPQAPIYHAADHRQPIVPPPNAGFDFNFEAASTPCTDQGAKKYDPQPSVRERPQIPERNIKLDFRPADGRPPRPASHDEIMLHPGCHSKSYSRTNLNDHDRYPGRSLRTRRPGNQAMRYLSVNDNNPWPLVPGPEGHTYRGIPMSQPLHEHARSLPPGPVSQAVLLLHNAQQQLRALPFQPGPSRGRYPDLEPQRDESPYPRPRAPTPDSRPRSTVCGEVWVTQDFGSQSLPLDLVDQPTSTPYPWEPVPPPGRKEHQPHEPFTEEQRRSASVGRYQTRSSTSTGRYPPHPGVRITKTSRPRRFLQRSKRDVAKLCAKLHQLLKDARTKLRSRRARIAHACDAAAKVSFILGCYSALSVRGKYRQGKQNVREVYGSGRHTVERVCVKIQEGTELLKDGVAFLWPKDRGDNWLQGLEFIWQRPKSVEEVHWVEEGEQIHGVLVTHYHGAQGLMLVVREPIPQEEEPEREDEWKEHLLEHERVGERLPAVLHLDSARLQEEEEWEEVEEIDENEEFPGYDEFEEHLLPHERLEPPTPPVHRRNAVELDEQQVQETLERLQALQLPPPVLSDIELGVPQGDSEDNLLRPDRLALSSLRRRDAVRVRCRTPLSDITEESEQRSIRTTSPMSAVEEEVLSNAASYASLRSSLLSRTSTPILGTATTATVVPAGTVRVVGVRSEEAEWDTRALRAIDQPGLDLEPARNGIEGHYVLAAGSERDMASDSAMPRSTRHDMDAVPRSLRWETELE